MSENMHVSFEYTADEAIAFQADYIRATKEGSSWRKREQLMFAIALIAVVGLLGWLSSDRSPASIAGLLGFTLVIGPIATVLFGRYYDHMVERRVRRLMVEQLGGPGPYTCTIEIRTDGLWVAQPGVHLTFPWRDAKNVENRDEGIVVSFAGGRVLARTRGFSSPELRSDFFDSVRKHMSEASSGNSAG